MASGTAGDPLARNNGISFQDLAWMQTFGLGRENVMAYFMSSPFYKTVRNDVEHEYLLSELTIAAKAEPRLFVIKRVASKKGPIVERTANVLDGKVYLRNF